MFLLYFRSYDHKIFLLSIIHCIDVPVLISIFIYLYCTQLFPINIYEISPWYFTYVCSNRQINLSEWLCMSACLCVSRVMHTCILCRSISFLWITRVSLVRLIALGHKSSRLYQTAAE